jgi:prepilin-type N-terminal cleavage/methylation domain-containing protein
MKPDRGAFRVFKAQSSGWAAHPFGLNLSNSSGFSLLELVVALAVIGVLIALALPNFSNIRRDAQISQAKNTLAVLLKECAVARARGVRSGQPLLRDARSSKASLSGFKLVVNNASNSQDVVQPSAAFYQIPCFQLSSSPEFRVRAVPDSSQATSLGNPMMPEFVIAFSDASGATEKRCFYRTKDPEVYVSGCAIDPSLTSVLNIVPSFLAPGTWE